MINVTKTYLPDKKKYKQYIDQIYATGWVTNRGPLVQELESRLAEYLGVKNLVLVANGTVALEIAYRTLDITGDVITTPFSFVATTSSLVTNGLNPVYADIDPDTLNIDPTNIRNAITQNTSAIVPVHVFGNRCDVDQIEELATENNLKTIYDAAHAFGVQHNGKSILNYGNISTLSFHATKLFHTIEGGALVINDDDLVKKARYLINFGIENRESIPELGTNAKMNEFEAAMGLAVLDDIDIIRKERKAIYDNYQYHLEDITKLQHKSHNAEPSYGYFPVIFKNPEQADRVEKSLNLIDIYPRKYFYPSLNTLSYITPNQKMPVSESISNRVLCMPIYPGLSVNDQSRIIKSIKNSCEF